MWLLSSFTHRRKHYFSLNKWSEQWSLIKLAVKTDSKPLPICAENKSRISGGYRKQNINKPIALWLDATVNFVFRKNRDVLSDVNRELLQTTNWTFLKRAHTHTGCSLWFHILSLFICFVLQIEIYLVVVMNMVAPNGNSNQFFVINSHDLFLEFSSFHRKLSLLWK